MRSEVPGIAAWVSFALVVACGCYVVLAACDLGIRPIFGLQYCKAQAVADRFANERARERDLRERIHEAELRIARLPNCAASPPPPAPVIKERAEAEIPPPPPPPPKPEAAPREELTIPQKISDLKGCWQSVRGDLPLVSDDREQRPMGNVRICYCFADGGRGSARYFYTDGRKCVAPARARLSDGKLLIDYARCVVPTEIICSSRAEGDSASCEIRSHGRFPSTTTDERFQRVTAEHCR